MIQNKEVYILCAAVWFDDNETTYQRNNPNNISTGYVITGRRHENCFYTKAMLESSNKFVARIVLGFLTNTDLFLTRKEAAKVAYEAGQVPEFHDQLISEHLY